MKQGNHRETCVRAAAIALLLIGGAVSLAATQGIDLDGDAAAESRCDLNVLSTFPVRIENVVTNAAVGEGFEFNWVSAGPGGFSASVPPGTTEGVGAVWEWTTNQAVFTFVGNSCESDICFTSDSGNSTCTLGCEDDGVVLTVSLGSAGETLLNWTGGNGGYRVFQADSPRDIRGERFFQLETDGFEFADTTTGNQTTYYLVRGTDCFEQKTCGAETDCNEGEGECVSAGPFTVPGRSLLPTDVTVSSASLTSSIVTFFSPRREVFRITCTAEPGRSFETFTNLSDQPLEVDVEEFPPGCCPADLGIDEPLRCGEACVDYLNDPQNCGECGNVCGEGSCCSNGTCVSTCPEGQVLCDGQCVDLNNDSDNCGACGNSCPGGACCDGGQCTSECDPGSEYCAEQDICSDTLTDPENCGACGNVCGEGECCEEGICSARCEPPTTLCPDDVCYDLRFDNENCGECGNKCGRKKRCIFGTCIRVDLSDEQESRAEEPGESQPVRAVTCENASSPSDPICPNPTQTGPTSPSCPQGEGEPPQPPTPTCEAQPAVELVPPGGEVTICRPAGVLFREVSTTLTVCGDSIPGPDGTCGDGVSNVASGTFNRFVPDTETTVGDAFVTPFAVRVDDASRDGLLGAGEAATIEIDILNAGPIDIENATGTLLVQPVDLSQDGVENPLAFELIVGSATYGTIPGTQPSVDCEPVDVVPASSDGPYEILIPEGFPGDVSYPMAVRIEGTVNGQPFSMDMPINMGVADRCDIEAGGRDFDVLDGLKDPMARLVPPGQDVPFASSPFNVGDVIPLKLRHACGLATLTDDDIAPPSVAGLSGEGLGEIDVFSLDLDADSLGRAPGDVEFRYNRDLKSWIFNMKTDDLEPGIYILEIRIADRKNYLTGFELR